MECPICFGSTDMTTRCQHAFCSDCIQQLIRTSLWCPLCRQFLLDEEVAIKAHNETIRIALLTLSHKKRKRYWWKYRMLRRAVDYCTLKEEDMSYELISLLLQTVDAYEFIHDELVKAILHRDDYMKNPFEDWRTPFIKLK
jgi:hypothetical protein